MSLQLLFNLDNSRYEMAIECIYSKTAEIKIILTLDGIEKFQLRTTTSRLKCNGIKF